MNKFLSLNASKTNIDLALLILRLVFGLSMAFGHGWKKMIKLFTEDPVLFADPFGIGPSITLGFTVFAEVVCGLLLALGLFTRFSSIPLIITMLVAIGIIHTGDPFGDRELALLYLAPCIILLLTGAGRFSLDKMLFDKVAE